VARSRNWISFGLAAVLHALVIGAASRVNERPGFVVRGSSQAREIAIELDPSTGPGEQASGAASQLDTFASILPRQRARGGTIGAAPEPQISSGLPAPAAEGGGPEPGEQPRPAKRPSLAQIGVGAPLPFLLLPPARTPSRREALTRRTDQMLAAGLAQRDFERGLGPHGAVVSALRTATFSGRTPERGSALFAARIERDRVFVRVLEATADTSAWAEAAERAMRALRGKKSRLPAGARAVEITIRVTSNVELPSGADPGLELRALGIPLKKGDGRRSSRLELLSPRVELGTVTIPDPGGGDPIELPSLEVGLNVLGLFGDPADLGATPRRIVHTRVEQQAVVPAERE
jgi:hypothetical protein